MINWAIITLSASVLTISVSVAALVAFHIWQGTNQRRVALERVGRSGSLDEFSFATDRIYIATDDIPPHLRGEIVLTQLRNKSERQRLIAAVIIALAFVIGLFAAFALAINQGIVQLPLNAFFAPLRSIPTAPFFGDESAPIPEPIEEPVALPRPDPRVRIPVETPEPLPGPLTGPLYEYLACYSDKKENCFSGAVFLGCRTNLKPPSGEFGTYASCNRVYSASVQVSRETSVSGQFDPASCSLWQEKRQCVRLNDTALFAPWIFQDHFGEFQRVEPLKNGEVFSLY